MAVVEPTETTGGPLVAVEYQITAGELKRALRWVILRRRPNLVVIALAILSIATGVILLATPGGGVGAGVPLLSAGLLLLVLIALDLWLTPAFAWRRSEWLRSPQSLVLSDDGIQTRSSVSEGRTQWAAFKASFETEQCYILRLASRAHLIVPKRAFVSAQDLKRFRGLLERHTAARLWSPDHM